MTPIALALSLAGQFAPQIAKWITKSDKAAEVIADVVDVAENLTGKEGDDAIAAIKADPALAAQFQQRMAELSAQLERDALLDMQDARKRDVAMGGQNYRAHALVAAALGLVILCLAVLVWKSGMDDVGKGAVSLILGRALGWVEQIFSFEFGTTRTSKAKDEAISRLSK